MWIPVDNPDALTDEELTSAYMEFGLTRAEAGIYVVELRAGQDPGTDFVVEDTVTSEM